MRTYIAFPIIGISSSSRPGRNVRKNAIHQRCKTSRTLASRRKASRVSQAFIVFNDKSACSRLFTCSSSSTELTVVTMFSSTLALEAFLAFMISSRCAMVTDCFCACFTCDHRILGSAEPVPIVSTIAGS
jgi:hypothetical protein